MDLFLLGWTPAHPPYHTHAPRQINDGHDTLIDFAASFLEYWLLPLLSDPRFNDEDTLILLTFDENETHAVQNTIFSLALGESLGPVQQRVVLRVAWLINHVRR